MDDEGWVGSVARSLIDERVWVAVVPDVDMTEGAMAASTSLRRCRQHVARLAERSAYGGTVTISWRWNDGTWDAFAG